MLQSSLVAQLQEVALSCSNDQNNDISDTTGNHGNGVA